MVGKRLIQLLNIYKIYSTEKLETTVIKGVSFNVNEGDKLIVIGPSGSGKTTLMNILTGHLKPSAGQVYWKGYPRDIGKVKENELAIYRRNFIAMITQDDDLLSHLSVKDNILLGLRIAGKKIDWLYYNKLLELLGIAQLTKRNTKTLSRGEAKRVNIASALMIKPELIIGDEPVAGLDVKTANEILDMFDTINRELGTTFILTSHDQSVVSRGNKVLELKDGIIFGSHYEGVNIYNLEYSRKIPVDRNGRILIPEEILKALNNPEEFSIKFDDDKKTITLSSNKFDKKIEEENNRKCTNCGEFGKMELCNLCGYPTVIENF